MISLTHVLETALLMLAAYVLGCAVGYAVHRILYAARGTHQAAPVAATAAVSTAAASARPRRSMTPAARLAAAGSDEAESIQLPAVPGTPAGRSLQPTSAALTPAAPKAAAPKPATPRSKAPAKPAAATAVPQPQAMPGPRLGGADNLKQIKGIGPKIEASLNGLGIYHFDQIAGWSRANIEWVDKQLAFKGRITRERWVEQAAELARPSRISA